MGFSCGIVGLPNVGKSTLFNAMTGAGVAADNYPFCTIDPNVGVAVVPDSRLDQIVEIARPQRAVPAVVEFTDIAGLVAGASQGEGLGNQFLHHIREIDAIAHVVRCFEDPNVTHVAGTIDPIADIQTIDTELGLADLETVERAIAKAQRRARAGEKEAQASVTIFERVHAHLAAGHPVRSMELASTEGIAVRDLFLLTAKPLMYVANVGDDQLHDNPWVARVAEYAEAERAGVVALTGALEAELAQLDPTDRDAMLAEYGLDEPGLETVIHAAYRLVGLETFFTAMESEARAWTVRRGTKAPAAAGQIHTDFERGFVRAEVIPYEDYVAAHGEQGAKEAGAMRVEGRDYVVQEGDVIRFRFNV